ncbi:MAG: GGDEF domain-containing protein, partial [Clostridia bacterium]|nr:GGDEF domain-containing protein [Clostridia bacterium]
FFIIFYQYDTPSFLIQAFSAIVIVMAIFIVPNRWINMVLNALLISSGFFVMAFMCIERIDFSEASAVIIYMIIVIVLSSYSSFQWNVIKRKQYLSDKELIKLTITDALTGIFNRKKFDEELEKWIQYASRYQTNISLIILDLDNFKTINDNFGHLIGDKIILDMVNLIKSIIRQTDVFARWGGEEFTILLPHTQIDEAMELAERLREAIEGYSFNNVDEVTCSFGVASLLPDDDAHSLLHRADLLLYQAKKDGKNMVRC